MSSQRGVTILITGGAGFLGQHIVKELMEQELFPVKEIRTFDIQPFKWCYGLQPSKDSHKLYHVQGSICDLNDITLACEGADAVIHTCSAIAYGPYPRKKQLHDVNVGGTGNTLTACEKNNVECLIYTSSMEVANDLAAPSANTTEEAAHVPPVEPVFPAYSETKYTAERMVLDAHNKKLPNGKRLLTCALRPCGIYGEGERMLTENLAVFLNSAIGFKLGEPAGISQFAYAGNIAYSHVLVVKALLWPDDDQAVGGRAFFLGDGTPLTSIGKFITPFLEKLGGKMATVTPPFWLMYSIAFILTIFCWLAYPFKSLEIPFHTSSVRYMYGEYHYCWHAFRDAVGYTPRYSYQDSIDRSVAYCRHYFEMKDEDAKKK